MIEKLDFKKIKLYFKSTRYMALPQSVLPYIAGGFFASKFHQIDWFLSILGLLGVIFAHFAVNLFDDYFDFKNGSVSERKSLLDGGMRIRMGKCSLIESGELSLKEYLSLGVLFSLFAVFIGLIIAYFRGFEIILIMFITALLGFFYSAEPLRLSYRGIGELIVGIIFGPLLIIGSYLTAATPLMVGMTVGIPFDVIMMSVAIGLLVSNILYTHAVMDFEPDLNSKRYTLANLTGSVKNSFWGSVVLTITPYIIVLWLCITKLIPPLCAWVFLTLPIALVLVKFMFDYTYGENKKYHSPRFWMGVMENWETIKNASIDWFMIRWYLSRNLTVIFTFLLCIGYLAD